MLRFLFGMFFSVVIARWAYSEIKLSFPGLIPEIDYALERVQIPTHDKWPKERMIGAARQIALVAINATNNDRSDEKGRTARVLAGPSLETEPGLQRF
ncbi:MAG: hypothetical protein K1X83_05670 [Oligoflexia bacterium]|nr:hypothetical protein [Oligoflexia bacterium]